VTPATGVGRIAKVSDQAQLKNRPFGRFFCALSAA
jgi:hypothetical protein